MSIKSYEQIKEELNAKIPREAVSQREGGNGKSLSYLSGHYVIDRMNQVFGPGMWSYTSDVTLVHSGEIEAYGKKSYSVHYLGKVRLVADFGNGIKSDITEYGYGDGSDKVNIGKAHELAVKEAVTDALKRAAKSLGMSMGLALYSKEQENVQDEEPKANNRPAATVATPRAQARPAGATPVVIGGGAKAPEAESPVVSEDEDTIKKTIVAQARLVVSQKKRKPEEFQEEITAKYSIEKQPTFTAQVAQLSAAQAKDYLTHVKGLVG